MASHTTGNNDEIQGRFLGLPYDWRRPTSEKVRRRFWQPGGPMFVPKVFGWGLTANLAHPGTWIMLAGIVLTACGVAVLA